jgi:hypothetical protein
MRTSSNVVAVFLVVLAGLLACFGARAPGASAAGTYKVSFCTSNPPPLGFFQDRPKNLATEERCGDLGHLGQLAIDEPVLKEVRGTIAWKLTAPADTLITGLEVLRNYFGEWLGEGTKWQLRSGNTLNGAGLVFEQRSPFPLGTMELSNPPPILETFDISGIAGQGIPSVSSVFGCTLPAGGTQPCKSFRTYGVSLNDPVVTLEDLFPPSTPSISGSLLEPGPVSGVRSLTAAATDRGSGMATESLNIDGRNSRVFAIDSNNGDCRTPYKVLVPCSPTLGGTIEVDTTTLTNGPHVVEVVARDAAAQSALATVTISVSNPPSGVEPPVIKGRAAVGETLSTTGGAWRQPPTSFGFLWLRCPPAVVKGADASNCTPIPGTIGFSAYVPTSADVGSRLMVKVTASNGVGLTDAFSDPTGPVTGGGGAPPPDSIAPVLSRVSLTPKRMGVGTRAKPKRTTLRFTSSEAGTISVAVYRGKGKKPLATLGGPIAAGPGHLAMGPRIGKVRLLPGRYKLSVSANDAGGNVSRPVPLQLTVLR